MFLSFKQLAPIRFALYSLVQLLGAFFGAAIAYLVYCGKFKFIVVIKK